MKRRRLLPTAEVILALAIMIALANGAIDAALDVNRAQEAKRAGMALTPLPTPTILWLAQVATPAQPLPAVTEPSSATNRHTADTSRAAGNAVQLQPAIPSSSNQGAPAGQGSIREVSLPQVASPNPALARSTPSPIAMETATASLPSVPLYPTPTPDPTPTPAASAPSQMPDVAEMMRCRVAPTDTLPRIVRRLDVPIESLVAANDLAGEDAPVAYRWLLLPLEETAAHIIQPAENLTRIAEAHGTTIDRIRELNGIGADDVMIEGQCLLVPPATGAPPSP